MNSCCWQLDKYARATSASASDRDVDNSWQVIVVYGKGKGGVGFMGRGKRVRGGKERKGERGSEMGREGGRARFRYLSRGPRVPNYATEYW